MRKSNAGSFTRVHQEWSLENFDDGYVNDGRFRVYLPEHHRAFGEGYVLRAIAAYEAYHPGEIVTPDFVVHHKNKNRLDDSKENLEKKLFGRHSSDHGKERAEPLVNLICEQCGISFELQPTRMRDLSGGSKSRGRFCSQKCYHDSRIGVRRQFISRGGVSVEERICFTCGSSFSIPKATLKFDSKRGRFCSRACMYSRNKVSA